ncbi:MAG: cell division protein FtsL [Clostridiales bacterium]|nr:cell division protein FtsL [Clostridiales bacterium]
MRKVRHKTGGFSLTMTIVCIAFVIVAVLCATRLYGVHSRKQALLEEQKKLKAQKQALVDKNNAILAQGTKTNDAKYVESFARSQLDMVYPGEIIFRTTGD